MSPKFEYPEGSTPLNPDELSGLIPDFISLQSELNALEQQNILSAKSWLGLHLHKKDILSEAFVRELHRQMFSDVWRWAGKYRTSEKNIGSVLPEQISTQIHLLMKNTKTWIQYSSYSWPELLARFHHRLVFIHPFANGNGRFARLHTEALAIQNNQTLPSWGALSFSGVLDSNSELRLKYIESLRQADQNRFELLTHFLSS